MCFSCFSCVCPCDVFDDANQGGKNKCVCLGDLSENISIMLQGCDRKAVMFMIYLWSLERKKALKGSLKRKTSYQE